jgi:hypothetical protein
LPADGAALVDRFSLQKVAAHALKGSAKKYRVANCLKAVISKQHHISVYKNSAHNSVFFGGLQTCGSVWHCPVCASKISERRSKEVQSAIEYTKSIGGSVSFVTRTVPHTSADSLKDILTQFRAAETLLKKDGTYRRLLSSYGVFGSIKVYEITAGLNGWHLHAHELLFHDFESSQIQPGENWHERIENRLYTVWLRSATAAGFDAPSRLHGVQVQNGDYAAAYMAKWGKETTSQWGTHNEMTKQHIKKSKSGFSPFDLMRAFRDCASLELLSLIQEYGEVMHGAQQLIWSRGLKKRVNVEVLTDEEIAKEIEEEAALLGLISLNQWKFIIRKGYRAEVLLLSKYHGFSAMVAFLLSVGCPPFDDLPIRLQSSA